MKYIIIILSILLFSCISIKERPRQGIYYLKHRLRVLPEFKLLIYENNTFEYYEDYSLIIYKSKGKYIVKNDTIIFNSNIKENSTLNVKEDAQDTIKGVKIVIIKNYNIFNTEYQPARLFVDDTIINIFDDSFENDTMQINIASCNHLKLEKYCVTPVKGWISDKYCDDFKFSYKITNKETNLIYIYLPNTVDSYYRVFDNRKAVISGKKIKFIDKGIVYKLK